MNKKLVAIIIAIVLALGGLFSGLYFGGVFDKDTETEQPGTDNDINNNNDNDDDSDNDDDDDDEIVINDVLAFVQESCGNAFENKYNSITFDVGFSSVVKNDLTVAGSEKFYSSSREGGKDYIFIYVNRNLYIDCTTTGSKYVVNNIDYSECLNQIHFEMGADGSTLAMMGMFLSATLSTDSSGLGAPENQQNIDTLQYSVSNGVVNVTFTNYTSKLHLDKPSFPNGEITVKIDYATKRLLEINCNVGQGDNWIVAVEYDFVFPTPSEGHRTTLVSVIYDNEDSKFINI